MSDIGLAAAFAAGLLSFLSPCVLPLVPAYLSMASGYAVADIASGKARLATLSRSLAFTAGFTLVFTALGLAFSGAAVLLGGLSRAVSIASGAVIIALGANLAFDFIKILDRTAKPALAGRPKGVLGSLVLGMAFGAGWTPCVGPILASILVAAAQGGLAGAALLLLAYSAGLAMPFLAAGLFLDRLRPAMDWLKRRGDAIRRVSGALLVALGTLMILGRLSAANALAASWGRSLELAAASSPTAARIAAASAWALAAIALALLPALRRRGRAAGSAASDSAAAPGGAPLRKPGAALRVVAASVLASVAVGEALGLWSTARALAAWLSFQGA